jgi:hypothetical protein
MGIFNGALARWLGKAEPARVAGGNSRLPANSTQFAASQGPASRDGAASPHATRKEILKVVMRETLMRNGIPDSWLSADLLRTNSARREQGIHVRLLIRQWEPRLMLHGVALEQEFYKRLLALDPLAPNWLMGFSWQFAMADLSKCPPLPHPGSWTAPPQQDTTPGEEEKPITRAGDIIEGPVVIPQSPEDVRADLERLLALRDDDVKRHGQAVDGFAPTRPVQL